MDNPNMGHFKAISETKEAITWILERQAELRSELLAFYKKELKEIYASLTSLGTEGVDVFTKTALEAVERQFVDQWQRSYDLISPCRSNRSISGGAKIFPVTRFENVNNNDSKTAIETSK